MHDYFAVLGPKVSLVNYFYHNSRISKQTYSLWSLTFLSTLEYN